MSAAIPKLASKVRLRWDKREQRYMLIYPERGMILNEVAGAILSRCDGVKSIDAIATELAAITHDADVDKIRTDVLAFLDEMKKRGVLEIVE